MMLEQFNFSKSAKVLIPLLLLYLILYDVFPQTLAFRYRTIRRRSRSGVTVSSEVLAKSEINQFMYHAFEQFGGIKCMTFVWGEKLAGLTESLSLCHVTRYHACSAYRYQVYYEGGNVTQTVIDTLRAGYTRQCGGYVILLRETRSITDLLHQGDNLHMINTRAKFLIWYEDNDKGFEGDEIWEKIPNVILFHYKTKKRESGVLFTVRGLKWPAVYNSTESLVRVIEFWGTDSLKSNQGQQWYYDKTTDLKNATLKILVVEHPPGVIKYTDTEGKVEYAGTEVEIVKVLSKTMNFAYEFHDADPITKWGGQLVSENSSQVKGYYGAVARLIYGETDMAIGSFFILKHYLTQLDMSIPIEVACTSFITPNPLPRPRYLALILPFRLELWLLVLTICFVVGPIGLYFLSKIQHQGNELEYGVFRTRAHAVLTSFRVMSQVALHIWPKFWPVRLYIGWYWLFWLCMTLAYRAGMVSFLTIPLFENSIDNVIELEKSGYRIGGWGTELHRLFTQHLVSNSEMDSARFTLSNKYEVLEDLESGISLVAEGNFALYENVRYLRFIRLTRNLSKGGGPTMRLMKNCIVPVHLGFAYQKNSPITHTINRYIRSFQESGLLKRWGSRLVGLTREFNRNNYEGNENEGESINGGELDAGSEDSSKSRTQRVLTLTDLQGSIYLIIFGVVLSTLAFIVELFYKKSKYAAQNVNKELLKQMVDITRNIVEEKKAQKILDARVRKRIQRKVTKVPPFPYVE